MISISKLKQLVAAPLLALSISAGAQVTSTFDSDLDGWSGLGGAVSHFATGGNPGGFLQQEDTDGTFMEVIAPAKFSGNLLSYLNGAVSFDAKNVNGANPDLSSGPWFGTVVFSGPGGTAELAVAGIGPGTPLADGQWRSFSAQLDPALWSGDLAAVLSNVTSLTVVLEFNDVTGAETAGFDNFLLTPMPEPGSLALLTLGLGWLAARQRVARGSL